MADTLRIATCHVRNGRAPDGRNAWPFRRWRLLDSLDSLDADVLALQKAFAFHGRSRRRRGEQVPILERKRTLL